MDALAKIVVRQPDDGARTHRQVCVEGVNTVHKHVRRSQKHPRGGRIEKEAPVDISNVMLYCDACEKPTRPKSMIDDDGTKTRVCRHCEAVIAPKDEKK